MPKKTAPHALTVALALTVISKPLKAFPPGCVGLISDPALPPDNSTLTLKGGSSRGQWLSGKTLVSSPFLFTMHFTFRYNRRLKAVLIGLSAAVAEGDAGKLA